MKSFKTIASLLFALVLGASLAAAPAVAFADMDPDASVQSAIDRPSYVIDQDGLLSSSEIASLESMGAQILSKYDVLPLYVTVKSLGSYPDAESYASDFMDAYELDEQAPNGSVLFLLSVSDAQFALMSDGDVEGQLSSSVLEYLIKEVNPYLGRSDWLGAGETFFDDVAQTLSGKQANATSSVSYTAGTYVVDDYGLFSTEDRNQLEAKAQELAAEYDMGVYLLVVDYMQDSSGNDLRDPSSSQRTNFATSFYRANGLGLNKESDVESNCKYGDGIMLAIAVDSRDYVTIAYGQGSYSFSDEGISAMESAVTDELGDNDWYGGAKAYYSAMEEQLEYYSVRGEPYTEPDVFSFFLKILALLGIPAGVAFGKTSSEKAAMKTAREQTEAANYLVPKSFVLTQSDDKFINTTLSVVPKPKESESSSGGGGFGGGGWGGGGGGGFSSSGGGKF